METDIKETTTISNEEYRGHNAIANSDLKYLHTPRLFKAYKDGLIERREQTDPQFLGSLFEDYFELSTEEFDDKYILQPDDLVTPASPNQHNFANEIIYSPNKEIVDIEEIYKEFYKVTKKDTESGAVAIKAGELYGILRKHIEFQEKVIQEGKIPYTGQDFAKIFDMASNLRNDVAYQKLFHSKGVEVRYHVRLGVDEPITLWEGIQWKGELDYLIFNHETKTITVVDLKTTSSNLKFFSYDIKKYKYYRQLSLYKELVRYNLSSKYNDYNIVCRIAVVETTPYYEAAIIPVPEDILEIGRQELQEAATTIRWHSNNGWDKRKEKDNAANLFLVDWEEVGMLST